MHEVLGIYPENKREDERDYLLDPLTRSKLVRQVLAGEQIDDALPLNLFEPFAKSQIQKEVDQWKEATNGHPLIEKSIAASLFYN